MTVSILALDPGLTTGWALLSARGDVLGCGDMLPERLGASLDHLIRRVHSAGHTIEVVVEKMPQAGGVSNLAIQLEYVRRTLSHWIEDVFDLPLAVVLPGAWKTSRVAQTTSPPATWDDKPLSQHQRDAITMGRYYASRRDQ